MKICIAQTRPVKGNINVNINRHIEMIGRAIQFKSDYIFFPELSLTGYEPELASTLAIKLNDPVLDDFQWISNRDKITIGVGMPVKVLGGISIGMIVFQPDNERQLYTKKYIHADEEPYFIGSSHAPGILGNQENKIALAICYELSIPQHAEDAHQNGANIYIASVAKTEEGVNKSAIRLAEIAKKYHMTIMMSNCIGSSDNFSSAGKSAVWNNKGELICQLGSDQEGLIFFDSESNTFSISD